MQINNNSLFSPWDKLRNLCEEIWDLFYDDLSSFLFFLWSNCKNKEIQILLKQANTYIEDAWDICEKHTPKNDKNSKHSSTVKSTKLSNEDLAKKIWNFDDWKLKEFLVFLSLKIARDSYADKIRGRENLSNNLKQCSFLIKNASKSLWKAEKEDSQVNKITVKINSLLWK